MTQRELDCAVALATGEDVSEIRRLGFSMMHPADADFDPEPLDQPPLAIDWDAQDRRRYAPFLSPPPDPRLRVA